MKIRKRESTKLKLFRDLRPLKNGNFLKFTLICKGLDFLINNELLVEHYPT